MELVKKLAMGSSEVAIDADVSKPLCKATSDAIKNYKWSSFKDGTSFVKFSPLLSSVLEQNIRAWVSDV